MRPAISGTQLIKLAREVTAVHERVFDRRPRPDWLSNELAPVRAQIRVLLEQCAAGGHIKTATSPSGY